MNTAADTLEDLMTSWDGETLVLRRDKPTSCVAHRGALLHTCRTGRAAEHVCAPIQTYLRPCATRSDLPRAWRRSLRYSFCAPE